eukprot:NODE_278_length_11936_cov_0.473644.p6 type:complete len:135 gc:universal NODE_278_length_11936_cov_0.473644:9510-9106(-)
MHIHLTKEMLGRIIRQIKYTKDHEWVKLNKNIGTVGISNFAQKALGEVVFVEVKSVGSEVDQGEVLGAVESVKAASDVYSPISGRVVEVNAKLNDNPNLINESPEESGWLAKIEVGSDATGLMSAEDYKDFCNK